MTKHKYQPNVKDKTKKGKTGDHLQDFMQELRHKVSNDDSDRSQWKLKQQISTNQRMGVKRYSAFPYPGAPDIPLPETDKLIKKAIPNLVLSAWAPKTMCLVSVADGVEVTPQLKAKAKRAELAINARLRSPDMNWFHKLSLAADTGKQVGHAIFKVYEEFKSRIVHVTVDLKDFPKEVGKVLKKATSKELEDFIVERYDFDMEEDDDKETVKDIISQIKSGDEVIEFDREEISSMPNVEVPTPTKIIVPSYATDINTSPRVTYEYFLTEHELEMRMEKDIFKKKNLKDLNFSGIATEDDDMLEKQKSRNEGVDDNTTDLYRIHEIRCWYKPEKAKVAHKRVFTFFADIVNSKEALLQDIEFPYEFDGWDMEKYDNEVKDKRYYASRGIPEQIRAIQEILERCINNMIIRDEMNNTPMYEVLDTSQLMSSHVRFVPGQKLPVKQIGAEIKALTESIKVDFSGDRIMQILKAYAEEYMGSGDQLFRNATNAGGGKTLGEIKEGVKSNAGGVNLDVINWNNVLSRVYRKMFDIMKERLGKPLVIDGQKITREDFNFPANVRSNGNLEIADQDRAVQKALFRMGTILNPALADIVNSEDKYNAIKDWLEKDGIKDPDQFCTDPSIIAKQQIAQLQQQVAQLAKQAEGLQEEVDKGNKDVASLKKKSKKTINQLEGEIEATVS